MTLLKEAATLVMLLAILVLVPLIMGGEAYPPWALILFAVAYVVVTAARMWFQQRRKTQE